MTKGISAYDNKERRKVRIRNHLARDLTDAKYHQRRREGKKEDDHYENWNSHNWLNHLDDENEIYD